MDADRYLYKYRNLFFIGSTGANQTRQLWVGLQRSCWAQEECSRKTRVLKYSGDTGPLIYSASFTGESHDEDYDQVRFQPVIKSD